MEQHPVPQNVTTFQFRLVGDMTLKQFGCLASGIILAYVSTKLPLPFFFTWPLTVFFALGGFGLAFVPVEERPMDIWVASFLRNTYSPTQYLWQKIRKEGHPPGLPVQKAPSPATARVVPSIFSRLYAAHLPLPSAPQNQPVPRGGAPRIDSSSSVSVQEVPDPFRWLRLRLQKITTPPHISYPNIFSSLQHPPLVQKQIPQAPKSPSVAPEKEPPVPFPPKPGALPTVDPQERVRLAAELVRLAPRPAPQVALKTTVQPSIHTIGSDAAVAAGLPKLTTFPNVVSGIVKDDRGNLLAGALVTVRDTSGTPLRALKTNKLGQFAASTPLTNGTYVVEIEDPQGRYVFDRAQISTTGTILPALEIAAKTKKQIERAKLERAIFGG